MKAAARADQVAGAGAGSDLQVNVELEFDGHGGSLDFPAAKTDFYYLGPTYRVFTVTPASHYSTREFVEQLSQVIDAGRKKLAVQLLKIFDP